MMEKTVVGKMLFKYMYADSDDSIEVVKPGYV